MSAYKIDNNSKRETRDCVKQLLEGARFIYKVIPYLYVIVLSLIIYGQDPASKNGIFRAPLLQILINKIWFKNKEDDGVIHPEFSENDMLPIATIAFVQTVVSYIFYNDYDCF